MQLPVPHFQQILRRDAPARQVVHADVVHRGNGKIAVREHRGHRGQPLDVLQIAVKRAAEHRPGHVPAQQVALHVAVVVGKAQQRIVAPALQLDGNIAYEFGHVGVAEHVLALGALRDDGHDVALPLRQRARRLVGHIAAAADDLLYALDGGLGHPPRVAVDDIGDGGHAHPCLLCDLFECDQARFPSLFGLFFLLYHIG